MPCATAVTCSSRGSWSTSSGRASIPATPWRSSRRSSCRVPTRTSSSRPCARSPGHRRAGPRQRPVHRARRRRLPAGGQPAGQPHACRSCPRSRACRWWRWRPASALGATLADLGWSRGLRPPPACRGGQGAGLLDHQAARRRPQRRPRHALDGRGHRLARRRRRGAGQGAPGGLAAAAGAGPGRRGRARLHRSPGRRPAGRAGRGAGPRRLPVRGHGGHGRRAARAGPRGARGGACWATEAEGLPSILDVIAEGKSRSSSTRRRRAPVRCATRRPSATPRSPRASSA